MFWTAYGFRTEYGSVWQGLTEFNSMRTEYDNHVVIFLQLSPAEKTAYWVEHTESDRTQYASLSIKYKL